MLASEALSAMWRSISTMNGAARLTIAGSMTGAAAVGLLWVLVLACAWAVAATLDVTSTAVIAARRQVATDIGPTAEVGSASRCPAEAQELIPTTSLRFPEQRSRARGPSMAALSLRDRAATQ